METYTIEHRGRTVQVEAESIRADKPRGEQPDIDFIIEEVSAGGVTLNIDEQERAEIREALFNDSKLYTRELAAWGLC